MLRGGVSVYVEEGMSVYVEEGVSVQDILRRRRV